MAEITSEILRTALESFTSEDSITSRTVIFFFSSRRRHTRSLCEWSSDVCSSDLDVKARAALSVYSTLLGGSMGSRLFDEIREQRGLAYSVYSIDHVFADVPIL